MSPGIFNLSERYDTDLTPAHYTFTIWAVIYWWQLIWLVYAIVSIFRKGAEGPLYRSPVLLPPVFFIFFTIANILNITRFFLWDMENLIATFLLLLFVAVTLYICIGISMIYLKGNLELLEKIGLYQEKWYIWIGVQNGLAVYATWVTAETALNFAISLQYYSGVIRSTSGTVALSTLLFLFTIWTLFDILFLDKYTRYLFMPYFTLIWVFVGILVEDCCFRYSVANEVLVIATLGIVSFLAVVKLLVLFNRHYKRPILHPF